MKHQEDLPERNQAATTHALEQPPTVVVPADFAARVAAQAAHRGLPRRSSWAGFGLRTALASGMVLTLALFVFAPHAAPSFSNLRFDLEMLMLAELGAVGYVVVQTGLHD